MERHEELLRSWREAAGDLDVQVDALGEAVVVHAFGSKNGMLCALCATELDQQQLQRDAEQRSMGWSALGKPYLLYDRDLFADTLNDWGWCGDGKPPTWYFREPWSE